VTLDNDTFVQPSCVPTTETTAPATTTAATTTTAAAPVSFETFPATTAFVPPRNTIPSTGKSTGTTSALGAVALLVGAGAMLIARRRRPI
jgi:LPXTG-motif cell wall-anchored protein